MVLVTLQSMQLPSPETSLTTDIQVPDTMVQTPPGILSYSDPGIAESDEVDFSSGSHHNQLGLENQYWNAQDPHKIDFGGKP